jgi:hypothetical protein
MSPSPALDTLVLGGGGGRAAVQPLVGISTLAPLSCDAYMPFYLSRATLHHGRPPLLPPPLPRHFRRLSVSSSALSPVWASHPPLVAASAGLGAPGAPYLPHR